MSMTLCYYLVFCSDADTCNGVDGLIQTATHVGFYRGTNYINMALKKAFNEADDSEGGTKKKSKAHSDGMHSEECSLATGFQPQSHVWDLQIQLKSCFFGASSVWV
jgi:hypothetical protein